jgi:Zn-dependent peptidase ImmA (M78 family)
VAHELGHYLRHFRPLLAADSLVEEPMLDAFPTSSPEAEPDDLPVGQITLPGLPASLAFEQMEREANQFAAELLMPDSIVRSLALKYSTHFKGEDLVVRLATEMLVSRATMRWRLRNLKLISVEAVHLN